MYTLQLQFLAVQWEKKKRQKNEYITDNVLSISITNITFLWLESLVVTEIFFVGDIY